MYEFLSTIRASLPSLLTRAKEIPMPKHSPLPARGPPSPRSLLGAVGPAFPPLQNYNSRQALFLATAFLAHGLLGGGR